MTCVDMLDNGMKKVDGTLIPGVCGRSVDKSHARSEVMSCNGANGLKHSP